MPSETGTSAPGVMAALRNISAGTLDLVQTRLGLLANEIQIQKHLWVQQVWTAVALLFCLALALLLLVALAVLWWWEQRLLILSVFTLLFAALSLYFFARLRRVGAQQPPLLALSLGELQQDVQQLKQAFGHEPKSD